jgi:hypothetical protein
MPFGQHPVFRRAIVPWYDSETACTAVLVLMGLVLLFGLVGLYVAQDRAEYQEHVWVPAVLVMLSVGVIISTAVRMIRRR